MHRRSERTTRRTRCLRLRRATARRARGQSRCFRSRSAPMRLRAAFGLRRIYRKPLGSERFRGASPLRHQSHQARSAHPGPAARTPSVARARPHVPA
eukprot:scaffold9015_cov60-Phaeocystis_antarctica.AAC.6